jgi:hypothetical protein
MAVEFNLVFDCVDPVRQARFWAAALGYQEEPPPSGFESWSAFWQSKGVPAKELGEGEDAEPSIVDPSGAGPRIWFQKLGAGKVAKNRIHLDLHVSGGYDVPMEVRRERIHATADRLVGLGAVQLGVLETPGVDHYAVAMWDPEGNEFDLN